VVMVEPNPLAHEEAVRWRIDPDRLPYVRESHAHTERPTGPPDDVMGNAVGELLGWTDLAEDAEPDRYGCHLRRRFWRKDYDRGALADDGTYAHERPAEAVDPRRVRPGRSERFGPWDEPAVRWTGMHAPVAKARCRREAYGRAALESECATVASTAVGFRNSQLNASAFKVGQLVGADVLDAHEVAAALLDAARACDLDEREAAAAIRSGLRAGVASPRRLPS
jgi:hypothetical protein